MPELAFLFVNHDLNIVRMMCDRTIVLQQGKVVEAGPSAALFQAPQADYTRRPSRISISRARLPDQSVRTT
jgi:ABC-type microcin C transport system duplicated ATPase subunit YejF